MDRISKREEKVRSEYARSPITGRKGLSPPFLLVVSCWLTLSCSFSLQVPGMTFPPTSSCQTISKLLLPPGMPGCPWFLGFFEPCPYGYRLPFDKLLDLLTLSVPSVSGWDPGGHSSRKYVMGKCNHSLFCLSTQGLPQRFPL